MRNIKLILAYDGSAYHGYQRQANAMTIQQLVEERLGKIFGHSIKLNGSARTDAGVHAYGQVVNFFTEGTIPAERIALATKGLLPPDIVIVGASEESPEFHARRSAQSKIYRYRLLNARLANPFERNYTWHCTAKLDTALMHEAAQAVVGTHDFSAFRATGGAPVSPVRTIMSATCREVGNSIVELEFWGTGFLYHMVRNLVGTLVKVGQHRLTPDGFAAILAGRDRRAAGMTAPPQGLFLVEVKY
ncbi:tRNA pseudouridine(38-40) synthase TruA [Sporomusa sp.]|uniref:tRNA pseudouridine(38-40) synthase TruA n=1 Tax=Sporomusa sp. TaxID=2078658 RepID=UPI002C0FB54C|nr:tRNA pseudouridine(38-40) synthase TruA [Sporomusa sp.]HWR44422.1 tRNA pseudouridine(38-40) synthase TruA [Sporomusa sp.]